MPYKFLAEFTLFIVVTSLHAHADEYQRPDYLDILVCAPTGILDPVDVQNYVNESPSRYATTRAWSPGDLQLGTRDVELVLMAGSPSTFEKLHECLQSVAGADAELKAGIDDVAARVGKKPKFSVPVPEMEWMEEAIAATHVFFEDEVVVAVHASERPEHDAKHALYSVFELWARPCKAGFCRRGNRVEREEEVQ